MRRTALAGLAFAFVFASAQAAPQDAPVLPTAASVPATGPLTLEQIMADPDWIGPQVEDAYWSVDGRSVYFKLKRKGSQLRDLYRVDAGGGTPVKLDDAQLASADGYAVFDRAHAHAAFLSHGDVFVRDLAGGATRQLTRSDAPRGELQFSPDGRLLSWHEGDAWMVCDLASGTIGPAATLKTEKDPEAKQPDQLERLQLHLFSTLREIKADKEAQQARERKLDSEDATRAPAPFYLGDDVKIDGSTLSPDARWMIVVTSPKDYQRGDHPTVTHYVNDSGYPQAEKARTYVGRNKPAPESLVLLDLRAHKQYALSTAGLPGIHDDPLKALRDKRIAQLKQEGRDDEAKALAAPKTRPVSLGFIMVGESGKPAIVWSDDAKNVAIELMSNDHKDRWIVTVDFNNATLVTQDRLSDPAWINWSFNELGWLHDGRTLWFDSEASGWSQLYVKPLGGKARALTGTGYEVSSPTVSPDDKWFYVLSNKQAPYDYDVYRLPTSGGAMQQVTHYEGLSCFECSAPFALSPDGGKLAVLHSSAYIPPQLAVVDSDGSHPHDLTDTRTPEYKAIQWIEPQFVKVPSSHGHFGIWAKYYQPPGYDTSHTHPAVLFVHGAGYLQDVTKGWSYYFREQMFNNLLAQEGYV
ncbi:MAG TPA: DPP IV N-terminal domain-containing protein, partial [Rhodanobacteraceae bacterium]